jgi:hypothetical protein
MTGLFVRQFDSMNRGAHSSPGRREDGALREDRHRITEHQRQHRRRRPYQIPVLTRRSGQRKTILTCRSSSVASTASNWNVRPSGRYPDDTI